ncbi:serine/threonine-protein kinase ATR-like isoform X2 [Phlebotomus papatasi]|uniref:serine/threonine-protein kinase ATR-like isoform X2 n=1 Tax=Phlebotomus papatasi TaxID=29031 RepID=UPI002483C945|nr:serine/threonine-protein kinase ATR-like isoform X2 [Phlebotomus papatasi]
MTKLEAFKYQISSLDGNLKTQQLAVLIAIQQIVKNISYWWKIEKPSNSHLLNVAQTLKDLCEAYRDLIEYYTMQDCGVILKIVLNIIKTFHMLDETIFERLKECRRLFIDYAKQLSSRNSLELNDETVQEIIQIINWNYEVIELLENSVISEVQKTFAGNSMLDKSKIWNQLITILKTRSPDLHKFQEYLLLFSEIIRIGVKISQKTSTKCLGQDINDIVDLFTKTTELCAIFTTEDIRILIYIAQDIMSLPDFKDSSGDKQSFIFEVVICPLNKILKRPWKCLPANFVEILLKQKAVSNNQLMLEFVSLRTIFSIREDLVQEWLLLEARQIVRDILGQYQSLHLESQQCLCPLINSVIVHKLLDIREVQSFMEKLLLDEKFHIGISKSLKQLICILSGEISSDMCEKGNSKFTCILCKEECERDSLTTDGDFLDPFFKLFSSQNEEVLFNMTECIKPLVVHFPRKMLDISTWKPLIEQSFQNVREKFAYIFPLLMNNIYKYITDVQLREKLTQECQTSILNVILKTVRNMYSYKKQYSVLILLDKYSECKNFSEETFMQAFKMMFLFIINMESKLVNEAILLGNDMCLRRGITTRDMLNWYGQDIFRTIVSLCVGLFLKHEIGLYQSLTQATKMLGFISVNEFISQHYKLIIAMILPWCLKDLRCKKLLLDVCHYVRHELNEVLSMAFLHIYTYLFLHQSPEVNNKCIDYVMQNTSQTLFCLLHADIKRTIAGVLAYYHRNPEFVMHAFQNLLSKDDVTLKEMADYISTRFLGVLTTFESLIVCHETEKALKKETLLSLGDIMRFMGPEHVTPCRFKILTLLKTALTNDDLKNITGSVWTIFLRTVDVQCLGPLLSTIVVSLEPLLPYQPEQVNDILHYLIVENRTLLSSCFGDLFFIEEINVKNSIKAIVNSQKTNVPKSFEENFDTFRKHINHENLDVRTYGFKYLSQLFAGSQTALNKMVFEQTGIDGTLLECLESIMHGCRHTDENLQLESGICLGELGAVEPSHLPPNYAPQKSFALTIHSDEFAIMALAELCKAYQSQKDSHCVDSFSLAIQEILQARGVNPKKGKKLAVWQAIPERMRQLMEPLLTSCYTGVLTNVQASIHPVFGSLKCSTMREWTFIWASNMIYNIQNDSIRHVLNSLRPSLKYDMQTLAMFLPYVILHALQFSNDESVVRITEEFQHVFDTAAKFCEKKKIPHFGTYSLGVSCVSFMSLEVFVERETREEMQIKCAKMAFNQLDFLEIWLQHFQAVYDKSTKNPEYMIIKKFVEQFDKKILAKGNFNCGEYARSLQCLEEHIAKNPEKLQDELAFLAEIHAELMDQDSVEGAIGLMNKKLELPEQITINAVTGRVADSAVCFEKLMQNGNTNPGLMNSLVQYYLTLDQPETALLVSEGFLHRFQDFDVDKFALELRAEPLWQMGRFEDLENMIKSSELEENNSWGIRCGSLLISYYRGGEDIFANEMKKTRLSIMKSLRSAEIEQNTYQKAYSGIQKLHMVTEVEGAFKMIRKICEDSSEKNTKATLDAFFRDWHLRIRLLQPSVRVLEPVLRLRRVLLTQGKKIIMKNCRRNPLVKMVVDKTITGEIGKLWMKSAELARSERLYQQAQLYLLNLEEFQVKNTFLEQAKLLWSCGDQANTFQALEKGLRKLLESRKVTTYVDLPKSEKLFYAEGKFLIANYSAEAMNIETDLNINYFRDAIEVFPGCEKTLVHYAQFLDKIFHSLPQEQQVGSRGTDLLKEIMLYYGKSLQYGCNYLFQSMPRMLSIWLDYTAVPGCDKRALKEMTDFALVFSNNLPSYMFFTAFSQLVSRICHPATEVYQVLRTILIKLILDYPQQSLWMILSVLKSSYASRSKRCIEVINDQRLRDPITCRLISDFNRLAEKLIELTNKYIPAHVKDPTVSSLVPQLPLLFKDSNFSKIVIPAQKFMQPELPNSSEAHTATITHNAFPRKMFYIHSIKNNIVILKSLQRPRKVVLLGDDGLEYTVLMKPKDDLRKDFRLMEFNAVVKQYLRQDPETRQRRLQIRTYSVLPLNEECGIIEWVSNLTTLRSILLTLYRRRGIFTDMNDIKKIEMAREKESKSVKREIFENILCKRHPPILGEWFKTTFTTPFNWYQARSSYIRTTAVMSIVGYILGLGDRHGENILFDNTNGDSVHVDFNCLFNKGESLQVPEVVPFRLTHNMVHAMGPLGVEGLYRKCCEVTLRVLQSQMSTLMSVLRPFVYDPLVSWTKKDKDRADGKIERTDPQALTNLNQIEERLKGYVKINGKRAKMPLSTEGQVNFVIQEATDINNLSVMYIGWGAYM